MRQIGALANRRATLAEAELARAKRADAQARQQLTEAQQALRDCIADVAVQRERLLAERQTDPGDASALRRWRVQDQRQIDRIGVARETVAVRERARDVAMSALAKATQQQRALARRREKYVLLADELSSD